MLSTFDCIIVPTLGELRAGDLVLLKGSRGMALERLTEILIPGEKGGA